MPSIDHRRYQILEYQKYHDINDNWLNENFMMPQFRKSGTSDIMQEQK